MKKKLLVQVSVTESDFELYGKVLFCSLNNLVRKVKFAVSVILVYQSSGSGPSNLPGSLYGLKIVVTPIFGVSAARNAGLDHARQHGYDYILFHDASVFVTDSFVELVNITIAKNLCVSKGVVRWTSDLLSNPVTDFIIADGYANPIYDTYVGSYVFNVDFLSGMSFSNNLGPGSETVLKAGEDVVFLNKLFSYAGRVKLPVCKTAFINHLPRPADGSKRLMYAEAQGVLLRWMLNPKRVSLWGGIYFFAFFGNALFSCVLRRKNSFEILTLRLKGFCDFDNKRRFIN
ncbi:glycosyltransferase family 2 protein [Stutzerimonas chloritidismutans]|uniref:glycosyltransferase family 2 protein n=1 Tax=Stutzerimonas TaxID=2901164 RepID=UPI0028A1F6B1|nr:glycosyltransferase family 2 protein [Stutzerimonas nitrititolerans]